MIQQQPKDWYSNTLKAQWKILPLTCTEIFKYHNVGFKSLIFHKSLKKYDSMIPKYIYGVHRITSLEIIWACLSISTSINTS
jgi:hypothetical protein